MQKLNNFFKNHKKITAFLLGSLSVQAFPPFYHWYLLFICLSGLLLLVNTAQNKKQAFSAGYWFGFGFFSFGLAWVNNALLVHPEQTGWLVPITFLISGAFLGLFLAFPALLSFLFKSLPARWLALGSWIVIFEWLRSWILTGFPWNLWGSCLAVNSALIQGASVIGTYGLSLILILTSSAPTFILNAPSKRKIVTVSASVASVILLLWAFGTWRLSNRINESSETKIRFVQPSISQTVKWSKELQQQHFQKYIELSRSQPLTDIAAVIWGETASPYQLDMDSPAMQQALQAVPDNGFLITGQVRYEDNYYGGWWLLNSALAINHQGVIEDSYDKSHLVPFGEYIPLREYLPDFIRPVANTIGTFKPGTGPRNIKLPTLPPFGIQICYEIIFPHHIITQNPKPEWLINLTNDGWYGISSGPYQHLVSTRLRAAEEGITIARSANSGISALINPYGETIAELGLSEEGILDAALPKQLQIPTVYNRLGNFLPLLLCSVGILLAWLISRKSTQLSGNR